MSISFRIALIIFIAFVTLTAGLVLRRLLVRRLKKTVLDNWLIQTIGIIVLLLPLLVAASAAPFVLDSTNTLVRGFWEALRKQFQLPDFTTLIKNTIESLFVLILGIGIARTLFKLVLRSQVHIDINLRTLFGRVIYILVMTVTAFWVLSLWQIAIDLPVAIIGTLAVAVTFAVQDILKDLVAGFYILVERPFHIGDEISTATYTGKVEDVQIRATKLRILSGEQVTIPNSMVFGGTVVNNSFYGERRATITITLPQQEEFSREETPKTILKTLQEIESVMVKPEPAIYISGYTGNAVTLTLRFWIASKELATVSEVMYTLRTVLPTADLAVVESGGNI